MKLTDFRKKMQKACFTLEEGHRVAWETPFPSFKLQLHQWNRQGEILRLKRGVYCFPERVRDKAEAARVLYGPAYISLETALHAHGLIPDVPFAVTLVTPRLSRRFQTPLGRFVYRKIHQRLFWGYDPGGLMAEREKALIDYFYFNRHRFRASPLFWQEERFQNVRELDAGKLKRYSVPYPDKVRALLSSFLAWRKSQWKEPKKSSRNSARGPYRRPTRRS